VDLPLVQLEPWLQSYLSHANSPSAFPPPSARQPGKAPNPLVIVFCWENATYDDEFVASAEETINRLSVVAKAEGVLLTDPPALYGNYVDANTPLVDIYGENLPILQALKAKIDPNNVMGLAGGFKF
jgi:FAD/FMN-containing dehydrogenase